MSGDESDLLVLFGIASGGGLMPEKFGTVNCQYRESGGVKRGGYVIGWDAKLN